VVEPVNRLDLSSDVVFLRLVKEVDDRRMLFVSAKNLSGFFLPCSASALQPHKCQIDQLVRLVHVLHVEDRDLPVISQIAESQAGVG
jgi:hypothetical protein